MSQSNAQNCISAAAVIGRHVVAPDAILFETVGPANYRNILARPCPGLGRLGPSTAIAIDSNIAGQICSGDRFRPFDSRDTSPTALQGAAVCLLGKFVPVPRNVR